MSTNKTKFRPILFSTPMVQALLEGRKTMTRRTKGLEEINENPTDWNFFHTTPDDKYVCFEHINRPNMEIKDWYRSVKIPYEVGDVLWVRETFYPFGTDFIYKANPLASDLAVKWKPSLFMPREACRIFFRIKSIRVERLQGISENDAISEGVFFDKQFKKYRCYLCETKGHQGAVAMCEDGFFSKAKESFRTLWKSINGQSSFHKNPFVFVYEFERIEKPLDFN